MPASIKASAIAGVPATLTVTATALRAQEITGDVYPQIVDSAGVILPNPSVLATSPTEYTVVLQTAPSLAAGHYQGTFVVRLCRDQACTGQYPGSPVDLPYDLVVVPTTPAVLAAVAETSLDSTMHLGTAARRLNVSVGAGQMTWSVATNVGWARPLTASGKGSGSFAIEIDPTGLAEGLYRGEVKVSAADGQQVVLPLSLNLIPSAFAVADNGFAFQAVNGAPIASQAIAFALDTQAAAQYTLSSDSAWLTATPSSGVTPGSASLGVDPSRGSLASGSHVARLTLRSPNSKDLILPVQLTLTRPTLSTSAESVTFGGIHGREFTALPLKLSLNTGAQAWPWTMSAPPAWLQASAASGAIAETGSTLTLSVNPTRAPLGSSSVVLNAQARVNGDTVTNAVAVTINRDQRKILPSVTGIAMVSVPGWSRLSRQVTVRDNYAGSATWTAASDSAWLGVTRNGDSLTLQADPSTLPANTVSYATVTLAPGDTDVTAPEKIRVGLWKGNAAPAARLDLASTYDQVVADPIRPLVYAHVHGGPSIDVINVYTGQKTATIAVGGVVGPATVAPDGQHLYALDFYTGAVTRIDLPSLAVSGSWSPGPTTVQPGTPLKAIRPNGVEVVVSGYATYRASDGKRLADTKYDNPLMAASLDGKQLFAVTGSAQYAVLSSVAVDYAEMGGGSLFAAQLAGRDYMSNQHFDLATNADGSRVYSVGQGDTHCKIYDKTLGFVAYLGSEMHFANNVDVDSFGRLICGADAYYEPNDAWVYTADGLALRSYRFAERDKYLYNGQLVASSDGMMLIGLTNDPRMVIVAVGP